MTDSSTQIQPPKGWSVHETGGFIELIGPVWERRDGDEVELALQTDARHGNFRGVLQGGVVATLADRTMGQRARIANDFRPQGTVQLGVQYVAAGRLGDFLVATPRLVRNTRKLIFLECSVTAGDRVIATASGIWAKLDA